MIFWIMFSETDIATTNMTAIYDNALATPRPWQPDKIISNGARREVKLISQIEPEDRTSSYFIWLCLVQFCLAVWAWCSQAISRLILWTGSGITGLEIMFPTPGFLFWTLFLALRVSKNADFFSFFLKFSFFLELIFSGVFFLRFEYFNHQEIQRDYRLNT